MKNLIKFIFILVLISFVILENIYSQERPSYSGIVSSQGVIYKGNGLPDAIFFKLQEHKDINFQIALSDANNYGVITESRTRLFIGSIVEFNCPEEKRKSLDTCQITSFKWVTKKVVQEGKLHFSGIIKSFYMRNYGDGDAQTFLKLNEHPNLEFWLESKFFENNVVNWLGLVTENGTVNVGEGYHISLTCDKIENTSVCKITSLGVLDSPK
jgi:hypothetical protein